MGRALPVSAPFGTNIVIKVTEQKHRWDRKFSPTDSGLGFNQARCGLPSLVRPQKKLKPTPPAGKTWELKENTAQPAEVRQAEARIEVTGPSQ